MKDYVKEFHQIMQDESFSDSQVFTYADKFISELQRLVCKYKKLYEVKCAQYEDSKEILARSLNYEKL